MSYLNRPVSSGFRNTYKEQFVPLPLEQFARAAQQAQAKQDQFVGGLEAKEDELWKLKGVADDDNAKIGEVKNGFHEAAAKLANTDLTKIENQDMAKQLVKGTARDKDLEKIAYNYSQHQQYLKDKDDMMKAGTYQSYNDAYLPQLEAYTKNGGYKSGMSLASNIYKYEDVRPTQEQYFNQLRETGSDTLGKVADLFYKNGSNGISADKIGKTAAAAFQSYITTPAAQQEGRVYDQIVKNNGGKPPKGSNGKPMSKTDYIYGNLLSAGMEREGMSYTTNKDQVLNKKRDEDKKEKEEAFSMGTFQTQGANPIATGGFTFDFDEKGNIKGEGQSWAKVWDKSDGIFDFVQKAWNDDSFNMASEKDQKGFQLQAAAKLNGMKPQDYVNAKAGPDAKLTTTFHPLTGKKYEAANKQFYDASRNAGIFNNAPVMDLTTGAKGSMVEILRQMSKEGTLTNKKGEAIELSDNPSPTEIKQLIDETGMGVIGQQDPNYHSARGFVIGVGGRNISFDTTYGGTQLNNVPLEDYKKSKYEAIKAAGSVIEQGEGGEGYIHWFNEKTGRVHKTKLSDLKD